MVQMLLIVNTAHITKKNTQILANPNKLSTLMTQANESGHLKKHSQNETFVTKEKWNVAKKVAAHMSEAAELSLVNKHTV